MSQAASRQAKTSSVSNKKTTKKTGIADQIREAARGFGFDSLRPGQEQAVEAILNGEDCLVVMPTGSGKSAIYQIAGSIMEGVTLVVSPLIALQKDQVDSINERAETEALVVNSTQRAAETREAFEKIEEGQGKFLFLAPEQLRKQTTIESIEKAGVSLFVIDEAHCISEWGHDFRPDFLQLGPVIERLGHPVVLAMTATASAQVRDEITSRLRLNDPQILVHGFDRPNIYLRVDHFRDKDEKIEKLVQRVRWADKPGIVYVSTRSSAEKITGQLADKGVRAQFYHGGLKGAERTAIHEQFMADEAEVIVATNAFGMGIDKADVRFVYHFDIPDSLDSYYQEIGRAGRDGEKAEAVLFFRREDIGIQKFHTGEGKLEAKDIEQVAAVIADGDGPVEPDEISENFDLSNRKLASVIHRLEDVGALEVLPTGEVELSPNVDLVKASEDAAEEQERHKFLKQERLRQMQDYADLGSCRREYLLRYFGDDFCGPCLNCDNCEAAAPGIKVDPAVGTRREVA